MSLLSTSQIRQIMIEFYCGYLADLENQSDAFDCDTEVKLNLDKQYSEGFREGLQFARLTFQKHYRKACSQPLKKIK